MVEACLICFEDQGHESNVILEVTGEYTSSFTLVWEDIVTDQMRRCWKDAEYTTEQAACGLAMLLIRELTGYTTLERSCKGTGFDYWIGSEAAGELPFQSMARLEVSGIRRGDDKLVRRRIKEKLDRKTLAKGNLPAYIAVIEFGRPCSQVVTK